MGSFTRTMKLLASVLSIAAADYACCPYNEYGVPETNCITLLTEKSPFSPNNGALVAAESHAARPGKPMLVPPTRTTRARLAPLSATGVAVVSSDISPGTTSPQILTRSVPQPQEPRITKLLVLAVVLPIMLATVCSRSKKDPSLDPLLEVSPSLERSTLVAFANSSSQSRRISSDKSASLVCTSTTRESATPLSRPSLLK